MGCPPVIFFLEIVPFGNRYTFSYQQCYMKMLLIIKVICIVLCGLVKINSWWLITSNKIFFPSTIQLQFDFMMMKSIFFHLSFRSSFFSFIFFYLLRYLGPPTHVCAWGSHLFSTKGKSSKSISLFLSYIVVLQFLLVNLF